MVVAVNVPPGKNYELTRSSLEKMWQEYAKDELSIINLQVKHVIVTRCREGGRGNYILVPDFQNFYASNHTNTELDTR
jgi:hypothetical protein